MRRGVVVRQSIVVGALLLWVGLESFASIGIGTKLLDGNIPCITGEFGGDRLSVELGIGLRSINVPGLFNWTMIWVSGVTRLAFPMGAFAPCLGVGGIGVSLILSSEALGSRESLSALGMTGEGGLKYSFEDIGFPLRLFGGANITWIPVSGDVEDAGIGGVGIGWHIGATIPL